MVSAGHNSCDYPHYPSRGPALPLPGVTLIMTSLIVDMTESVQELLLLIILDCLYDLVWRA